MSISRYPIMVILTLSMTACSSGDQPTVIATRAPSVSQPTSAAPVGTPTVTTKDVIATKLRVPWGLTFLPDGSALVTERDTRRVMKLTKGAGHDSPWTATEVAVIEEARPRGEGGLMGIVASPNYAQDQTLFLYYTTESDNRVSRWKIGSRPEPILTGIPVGGNHNGGRLAFGPDGFLYATTGEVGSTRLAQDLGSLGGKILRMTPEGKPAPGNPYNSLVWTYGHRNVQGIAWDASGRMWATEFGQNTWDEINLIEKGKNYGWPEVEGAAGDKRFTDPIFAFPTDESSCSGTAVVGDILAAACLRGQRVILVHLAGGGALSQPNSQLVGEYGRIRTVAQAPDKSMWVLTSNHDRRCSGSCQIRADDDRIIRVSVGT